MNTSKFLLVGKSEVPSSLFFKGRGGALGQPNSSDFAQQSSKSQDDLLIFLSQVLLKYEYHQKNNSSWDYSEMLIPLTSDKKVKLMYYKALNKRILVSSKFPCWHLTSGKKPSRWVGPILKSFFTCTPKTTFLVALSGDKLTFLRLEKKTIWRETNN